jgi:hypothetical protein
VSVTAEVLRGVSRAGAYRADHAQRVVACIS